MKVADKIKFSGKQYSDYIEFWKNYLPGYGEGFLFGDFLVNGSDKGKNQKTTAAVPVDFFDNKQDTAIFIYAIAALGIILKRQYWSKDVIIHSPLFRFDISEEYNINYVPLFVGMNEDIPFAQYLRDVQNTIQQCYRYQNYPIHLIDDGQSDIPFQSNALVVYDRIHAETANESRYDLVLNIERTDSEIRYHFELAGAANVFEVEQVAAWFINILHYRPQMEIAVKDINLLSASDQKQLTQDANEATLLYSEDATLMDLFEKQVRSTPDAIAISYAQQQLSYAGLNERANQLAHYLRRQYNIGCESLVGVCIERSPEMVIAILAILKAGGGYVPIDVMYPHERKEFMIEDSGMGLLLTDFQNKNNEFRIETCFLAQLQLDDYPKHNPQKINSPSDIGYIIYTSGSTGIPKGVMVELRNVVSLITVSKAHFDIDDKDVWTLFHSICFDFSVWEIFGCLCHGGKLIVFSQLTARNVDEFAALLIAEKVTVLNQVPTVFSHLMEHILSLKQAVELSLRYVIFGGEALSPRMLERWYVRYPEVKLVNMYGITETTVHVTCKEVSREEIISDASNIGMPLNNLHVYIMDQRHRLMPKGVLGEIVVGGAGVTRGYKNRPQLNEERFIENPYRKGEKLYCSGDLGIILNNGEVLYKGRGDAQVKIRGFRVEPGEIERRLLEHELVGEVVVTSEATTEGHNRLVAYVVSRGPLTVQRLRSHLESRLPEYMMPAEFVELEKLPVTANGKVDKKLLPLLAKQALPSETEYVAPETNLEKQLALIWQEITGRDRIGVTDNLFALGLDSLKAIKGINRVHRETNVLIPVPAIFRNPTLRGMSSLIQESKTEIFSPIEHIADQPYYPLSHAQKRLWLSYQLETDQVAYNLAVTYIFEGKLNRDAFEKAFVTIVKRHESLRTVFVTVDGEPKQKINDAESSGLAITYIDLRKDADAVGKAKAWADKEALTIFDLAKGPLIRAVLLHLEDEKFVFLLTMHHIISDGVSMEIIVAEVVELYDAYKDNIQKELTPLKIQYRDYAVWQNGIIAGSTISNQHAYWMDVFKDGVPVCNLPTDFSRPAVRTFKGNRISFALDKTYKQQLEGISKDNGASLFMLALACVKTLLCRYTSQYDIVVGTPVAGRDHVDLEDQVGFYVNMLALRTRIAADDTFSILLHKIRKNTIDAFANQLYPFDKLVSEMKFDRKNGRAPVFDIRVELNDATGIDRTLDGIHIESFVQDVIISHFDLTFGFVNTPNQLVVLITYATDLFNRSSMDALSFDLQTIMKVIAENPNILLSEIELGSVSNMAPTAEIVTSFDFQD
jgi:amino acid adenylation domain-containing protein